MQHTVFVSGMHNLRMIDWLGFNGTFRTKHSNITLQLEKNAINEKVENVTCQEYAKWNHYNIVFVGKTL